MLSNNQFQAAFHFESILGLPLDPDLCDALVLALSGVILQQNSRLLTPFSEFCNMPFLQQEGWICGLPVRS